MNNLHAEERDDGARIVRHSSGKPRKKDFADMREFLRAAAAWAEANMSEWPWGGPKDEDDEYYFIATDRPTDAGA